MKQMKVFAGDVTIISQNEDDDLESSRLENLRWCKCKRGNIHELITVEECKCC